MVTIKQNAELDFDSHEAASNFVIDWGIHSSRGYDLSFTSTRFIVTVWDLTPIDIEWINSYVSNLNN